MTDAPEMAVWSEEDGMESAGAMTPCKGPPEYIRFDIHEAVVAENKRLLKVLQRLKLRRYNPDTYNRDVDQIVTEALEDK